MTLSPVDAVEISSLRDKHDSAPRRTRVPWSKFAEVFRKIRRTTCLVANCKRGNECPHKNGRAWTPAVYPPGAPRQKKFVEEISLLVVDLDHLTDEQLAAAVAPLSPYQRILHASHSDRPPGCKICNCGSEPGALHGQSCPSRVDRCIRAIIALSRPVTRDEWPRFWPTAMTHLKQPADPSTCDANRLYFKPSRPKDADYFVEIYDGIALDVDAILAVAAPDAPSIAEHLRVDAAGVVEPGQRHAMLKSVAGALRFRGAGYDEIEAALLGANKARCNPPKTDAEVCKIAEWAAEQPISSLPRSEPNTTADPADDDEEFARDEDGRINSSSQDNIDLAFRKLGVRFSYNEFANHEIIEGLSSFGPRLDDAAVLRLRFLIDERFHFLVPKVLFFDIVSDRARLHRFHPVRRYLDGLKWDGEKRIDRWLIDLAGAKDTPYVRAVSRIVLVAAVRRVRQPGAKYDEMLILESGQGTEKSGGLRALAVDDDWFADDLPLGCDTKRFIESTAGKWILEAGELKGMSRGDVGALKACLSRQIDEARMSYDRKQTVNARQFIIIGTTNETDGYLRDPTGNRRFWPVRIQRIDIDKLKGDRDQLWAEAAVAEAAGESIRLDPSLYEEAAREQEAREAEDDPMVPLLDRTLGGWTGKLRIEDAYAIVGIEPGKATKDQIDRLGRAIRKIGWERKRRRFDGVREYAYVRGTEQEREVEIVVEVDWIAHAVRLARRT